MTAFDGRLSIVVPCGRPERAHGTVASILAQDLPEDHELILVGVDVERLAALCRGRARVVPVTLPARRNPAATRVAGVEVATGRHLLFVDDDIDLAPDFLRNLAALLARETGIGAVGARLPGKEDTYFSRVVDLANFWSQQPLESGERDWLYSATLYMPAAVHHAVGGFNTALAIGEDVDLTQRTKAAGHRVLYAAELVARHNHQRTRLVPALRYFWTNGGLALHLYPPGPVLGCLSPGTILRNTVGNMRSTWRVNQGMAGFRRLAPAVLAMYVVFNLSLELHRHMFALGWMAGHDEPVPTRTGLAHRLLARARAHARDGRSRRGLLLYLAAGLADRIGPARRPGPAVS